MVSMEPHVAHELVSRETVLPWLQQLFLNLFFVQKLILISRFSSLLFGIR